jgi:hypothetical protein
MGNWRSIFALLLCLGVAGLGTGCSRQDTELLGSIGRKLMDRAGTATAHYRERIDQTLKQRETPPAEKKEDGN